LNGRGAYAEVVDDALLNLTGDWTVEAWFKDEDPRGFNHPARAIVSKGDHVDTREVPYMLLLGEDSLTAGVRTGGEDYVVRRELTSLGVDPSAWHHVAVSLDTSLDVLTMWLDGRQVGSQRVPPHSITGNTHPLELGRGWLGKIADVRIWAVARKAPSAKDKLNGPQPGLVAMWRFDASGSVMTDHSGNHHEAVLHGGAELSPDAHP
jgi:hypothetical protein